MRPFNLLIIISFLYGFGLNGEDIKTEASTSPINLAHALSLVDSLVINGETLTFIRIYANAPDYKPVKATGEGLACVDDAGRFMEVLETEIVNYGNKNLIPIAAGMTRFLLYLSREDGLWYNFIYTDGNINTTHQNSRAEFGWWAIRGLRGLAAAYNIFNHHSEYSQLSEKIKTGITTADNHIQAVLSQYPSLEPTNLGLRPVWLVKRAPDINGELLIALTKLHNTGDFDYRDAIEKISEGLLRYQYRVPEHDLDGMYFCWKNIWHNWGNNQALGLIEAYKITGDSTLLVSVKNWADSFIPFLMANNFPWQITVDLSQDYTLTDGPQIAYGINSIYRGLKSLAEVENSTRYLQLSEDVFQWFKGQNRAQTRMYDPETGRCFDGLEKTATVNLNSGAESTIECLLAIQMRGYF